MVFSSEVFLFLFLPIVLVGHWLAGRRLRNIFLLLASLFFYAWGETHYVVTMLVIIILNYLFGMILDSSFLNRAGSKNVQFKRKISLVIMLVINLLPLIYYKYSVFLSENFYRIFNIENTDFDPNSGPHLPIGISFFTFQAMSYLIDIYRKENEAQRSIFSVGLYISLFPQLIAGPIVRYSTVAKQLKHRIQTIELFSSGVERFVYGLGKKVLIANPLGYIADSVFSLPSSELTFMTVWLGIVCYALQIYFDFSGYSDMAIGLGRMLGFRFLENFNYPYISTSIREFWQRWHISLSSWFRDYLYIPLGGNRNGPWRTVRNLFLVFIICGLWHGASWNFVIWGLLHGSFLALERGRFGSMLNSLPKAIQHSYVLLVVLIAWVFFRAENLEISLNYLATMFSFPENFSINALIAIKLETEFYFTLLIAIIISVPIFRKLQEKSQHVLSGKNNQALTLGAKVIHLISLAGIFTLVCMEIANGSYNPFIYFRF